MTQYIPAFSWPSNIENFLAEVIEERPLLHVCSGKSELGDVTVDLYERADYNMDMRSLSFQNDSFGAVFADPPWNAAMKKIVADAMKEFLRVAPVAYVMSPWIWGSSAAVLEKAWVRRHPGINQAIVIAKYRRVEG